MAAHSLGSRAAAIGEVTDGRPGRVTGEGLAAWYAWIDQQANRSYPPLQI